ncbi:MAG: helix-turn-helix domain-containing protein [Bacteroidia bacterium]|nr:helix-turn-helix domain-containing protein [Bacteroidia bacterium]
MDLREPKDLDRDLCPIVSAIGEIGDKWILLILRESFIGARRFDEFQENLKVSKSVLSNKLNKMLELELLQKVSYKNPNERTRYEYHLTRKGKDLGKVIISLLNWGNTYLVARGHETIVIADREELEPVGLELVNSKGDKLRLRDTAIKVGRLK